MDRELKASIAEPDEVEKRILRAGATLIDEVDYDYIYFHQPEGRVLKLTLRDNEVFRTEMELDGLTFSLTRHSRVDFPDSEQAVLSEMYGEKCRIRNHRKRFMLGGLTVSINDMRGIGHFLIVSGPDPSMDMLRQLAGSPDVALVTESFDNL